MTMRPAEFGQIDRLMLQISDIYILLNYKV
jgi:hypothetical protein